MSTPEHALVLHDDGTDLHSTSPVCYRSTVAGRVPTPGTAVTLSLRLTFQNTTDQILLGAIGVKVQPLATCVTTMAEIRAFSAGVVPCLTVLGYYTPGDGGGGRFYWDAAATEVDNCGTIIVPDAKPTAGRWKRLVEGPLSVKWFGAKGDGITDDSPAIQRAVNVGPHIVFPPGTYICKHIRTYARSIVTVGDFNCWRK